jgi:biopolymer transport protein ExbB/TolQ
MVTISLTLHRHIFTFTETKMIKGRKLALWGAWLQLGPVFGILGTVIGMIGALNEISEIEQNDQGPAEALASNMSFAMNTTAIGIIAELIGLVFLLVG